MEKQFVNTRLVDRVLMSASIDNIKSGMMVHPFGIDTLSHDRVVLADGVHVWDHADGETYIEPDLTPIQLANVEAALVGLSATIDKGTVTADGVDAATITYSGTVDYVVLNGDYAEVASGTDSDGTLEFSAEVAAVYHVVLTQSNQQIVFKIEAV